MHPSVLLKSHKASLKQKSFLAQTFLTLIGLILALEGAVRDVVQPDHWLVRVLHNQILAILLGHHQVKDTSDNTPRVVHAKVDLLAKLDGFELLRSKDPH